VTTTALSIDGLAPAACQQPGSADELAAALKSAADAGLAVAPVGGATQLDLGMPPRKLDLALQTTQLNRVIEYEPADLTVTVEAGIAYAELQRLLAEQGQLLALDPPAAPGATIGGLIATNASGPLRFAYGTARDLVIGTRVANPDGTLTRAGGRVVKNVAGYDLNKLYIGSLGTVGVLVELSFKLAPIPPATATVVGQLASLPDASALVSRVLHSPLSPLAIELLGSSAAAAAGLATTPCLVVHVGGYPQAVQRQVRELEGLLHEQGAQQAEAVDSSWETLAQLRREAMQRALVLKAAVPIARTVEVVDLLERELQAWQPLVWAHAGNGVAYATCETAPTDATVLAQLRERVRGLGDNASLVIQRCPTALKASIDVWGNPGSALVLMQALKRKLDPRDTLNPGRYVGGI